MAEAYQELYTDAKFAIGPPVENGFYYDIDFGENQIHEEVLEKIEKKIIELARKKSVFERKEVSKEKALHYYQEKGNEYKVELIEDLEDGDITFYSQGNFTDICCGPYITDSCLVK